MGIITEILEGLSTVFTTYVPSFVGAVVDTVESLFITGSGAEATGTVVLGILVCVAGIAIVTSLFRVALRMLRIKRKA